MNRLTDLLAHGQSVWLDNIDRDMLISGDLKKQIRAGSSWPDVEPRHFRKGYFLRIGLRRLASETFFKKTEFERSF
jgi:hypothetical protein